MRGAIEAQGGRCYNRLYQISDGAEGSHSVRGRQEARMEAMLTPREQRILEAIVHVYITTVEPVASRTISRGYRMALSPATIRHVMGRLEELGYLSQPHISAGRIPTDKGYRFYVD